MKVSELIENPQFDLSAEVEIFSGPHNNGVLLATFSCGRRELPDDVLNSNITYMTVKDGTIVIECDARRTIPCPEITKMLTVSTAHVTQETYDRLYHDDENNEVMLPVYEKISPNGRETFGLYVYLEPAVLDWEKIPMDLKPLVMLAKTNGCGILCLDGDGPEINELPVYNW